MTTSRRSRSSGKILKSKTRKRPEEFDVVIVGGGPIGLAFSASLKGSGLRSCVIEKQPLEKLAAPAPDGRDLALTHRAIRILKDLAIWDKIPRRDISTIQKARVLNGTSAYALNFSAEGKDHDDLGAIISNHLVRKAAFETALDATDVVIRPHTEVLGLMPGHGGIVVTLSDGSTLSSSLLVAADSRFSSCRQMMGIAVNMRDFGRTAMVCRMAHEKDHDNIAHECFHYDRTLAVLPLPKRVSSVVITLPTEKAADLCMMPVETFNRDVTERFGNRLGPMKLVSERYPYRLVATYADRFASSRFALLGDAAVGMHPVTAHGYNFGLYSLETLSQVIRSALASGHDIGEKGILERYSRLHRRATLPLYLATNALVALYTNERPAARLARPALLRLGNIMRPAKSYLMQRLTDTSGTSLVKTDQDARSPRARAA